ncbi:hypothetical protein DYH09_07010 [bacterium CPR1]|nr:hypothetical protein [bacterium CPR1]
MERGISLAEVLVALAMVAALALGLVGAVINSTRLTETDRKISAATFLGQKVMELQCYRARDKSAFNALASFAPGLYAYGDAGTDLVYRLDVATLAEPGLKRLSVMVWEAGPPLPGPGLAAPAPTGQALIRFSTMVSSR